MKKSLAVNNRTLLLILSLALIITGICLVPAADAVVPLATPSSTWAESPLSPDEEVIEDEDVPLASPGDISPDDEAYGYLSPQMVLFALSTLLFSAAVTAFFMRVPAPVQKSVEVGDEG